MPCEGCKKRREKIKRVFSRVFNRPEPEVEFDYDEITGVARVSKEDYEKLSAHWRKGSGGDRSL